MQTVEGRKKGTSYLFFRYYSAMPRAIDRMPVLYCVYFVPILLVCLFYFFPWPIVAFDTDLWSHLHTGEYIANSGSLPKTSFYSFISPARAWVDYEWLFQWAVYRIYEISGYHGLIWLKNFLYLGALLAILAFLVRTRQKKRLPFVSMIILFSLGQVRRLL